MGMAGMTDARAVKQKIATIAEIDPGMPDPFACKSIGTAVRKAR